MRSKALAVLEPFKQQLVMTNSKKLLLMLCTLVIIVGLSSCKAGCGCPQW